MDSRLNWKRKIKNEKKIGAACAVDIAQIVSRRFFEGVKVGEIEIGSEDIAMEEINRTRTFSTMEITLTRAEPSKRKAGNE